MANHFHQPVKRRRVSPNLSALPSTTILDLNERCWKALLKYLPAKDLIRTERTCKKWQEIMLSGLENRNILIGESRSEHRNNSDFVLGDKESQFASLELWARKHGKKVTHFEMTWGNTERCVKIHKMFPYLEELELNHVNLYQEFPTSTEVYFPTLERLSIIACQGDTDDKISKLITSDSLEDLQIKHSEHMYGRCLQDIKSWELNSLVIRNCTSFQLNTLNCIAERLGGATKLVLCRIISSDRETIPKLLDKLDNLTYLAVRIHTSAWWSCSGVDDSSDDDDDDDINASNVFYNAVGGLPDLKHLSSNIVAWDQHVEQLATCCRNLKTIKLFCKEVTGRGLRAVWSRLGKGIQHIELVQSNVKGDDVVACIANCPELKWLRVGGDTDDLHKVLRPAVAARAKWCPGKPDDDERLVLICEGVHDMDVGSDLDQDEIDDLVDAIDCRSDSNSVNDSEGQLEYL